MMIMIYSTTNTEIF